MKGISSRIEELTTCVNELIMQTDSPGDGILYGKLSSIFYFYNLHKLTDDPLYLENTESQLTTLIDNINASESSLINPSLGYGKAGLAYMLNIFLKDGLENEGINDMLCVLDDELYANALILIEEDNLDFIHGAAGIIHYFYNRLDTSDVRVLLDTLIENICLKAIPIATGLWFKNTFVKENEGMINLSYSHGLSGFIVLLCNVYENSRHKELIGAVIWKATKFILSLWNYKEGNTSIFPVTLDASSEVPFFTNRLGWCYGDLNQALALYRAGKLLAQPRWLKLAGIIASGTLLRQSVQTTLITEGGFCHGSAGLAMIYQLLSEQTGVPAYSTGADFWLDETVKYLETGLQKGNTDEFMPHSILEGGAGIILTLITIKTGSPSWVDLLLL
jgi:lantibiotic modifying enzyme